MQRLCKACGERFEFEYWRGRPRESCFKCLPEGTRWIGKEAARKVAA
jgi:hypothetical protein